MKLSLRQLFDADKDLWNEWVSTNQNAHFFHLWEWGQVLSATYGYRRYYFAVECEGDIVGVLPLIYIQGRIFGSKLISLPFGEYGGLLLSDSLSPSLRDAVVRMFSKVLNKLMNTLKVDFLELRHMPLSLSSFEFFTFRHYMTFEIDLAKGEEELWRNLDKKCRNLVRKAVKSGVKIADVDDENLSSYYRLYLSSQKRHGSPPHSKAFFTNLFQTLKEKGLLRMVLASYDGKAIGGVMVFCFNGKMDWWNNAIDRRYARLNPTNLLLWEAIKWGEKNNFKSFYLGRTRPETTGIYHFKSGWGGRKVALEDQVLSFKRMELPDPLQRKYVILSKIWSSLPQALAQRLGPSIISEIGM